MLELLPDLLVDVTSTDFVEARWCGAKVSVVSKRLLCLRDFLEPVGSLTFGVSKGDFVEFGGKTEPLRLSV